MGRAGPSAERRRAVQMKGGIRSPTPRGGSSGGVSTPSTTRTTAGGGSGLGRAVCGDGWPPGVRGRWKEVSGSDVGYMDGHVGLGVDGENLSVLGELIGGATELPATGSSRGRRM